MVADSLGWIRGPHARVNTSRRGREDLSQWDFGTSRVLRRERLEVRAYEAAVQGCTDVVGMTLYTF